MKERPIIFSAPMIVSILDGRKSATRRLMRKQPEWCMGDDGPEWWTGFMGWELTEECVSYPLLKQHICPYGKPGGRLWVREAFRGVERADGVEGYRYEADGAFVEIENSGDAADQWMNCHHYRGKRGALIPSIHMPRHASRITLEVVDRRAERIQDISTEDAMAEGIAATTKDGKLVKYGIPDRDGLPGTDDFGWPWHEWKRSPREAFAKLWNIVHGAGAWERNDWVWALTFERIMG